MYPFYEDRLTPYLRMGGGYMDAEIEVGSLDDSESDFAFNLGIGMDFYVTDHFSIGPNVKYVWGAGDLDELEYFVSTFSVAFHF
jgi:opacity protein-like surface antigen